MLKDIEVAQKRANDALALGKILVDTLEETAMTHVDGIIADCVNRGLMIMADMVDQEIKSSTTSIHDHFQRLSDRLMGKGSDNQQYPDIEGLIDRVSLEAKEKGVTVDQVIQAKLTDFTKLAKGWES